MTRPNIVRIASLKTVEAFRRRVSELNIELGIEEQMPTGAASALTKPLKFKDRVIGNRWAAQPMEGWDGTTDGGVTEPMLRRWRRFGESGAKLIWGGEAMAVRPDGRANPNQLVINAANQAGIAQLREVLIEAHKERHGETDDLLVGFQLTHSGRFCKPTDKRRLEPRVAFRNPLLDAKFGVTSDAQVFTDDELKRLIDDYVQAGKIAAGAGADFVDIKHCHGYLLHEILAAHTRPGPFGGSLENRARMLREIAERLRAEAPGLEIGVRLSVFDFAPFKSNPDLAEPGRLGPGMARVIPICRNTWTSWGLAAPCCRIRRSLRTRLQMED